MPLTLQVTCNARKYKPINKRTILQSDLHTLSDNINW